MATDNTFGNVRRDSLPLSQFLRTSHTLYAADPVRYLRPVIRFVAELHQHGQYHGALLPSCFMIHTSGEVDLAFLKARSGTADSLERPSYYPHRAATSFEEAKSHDLEALAGVFHYIIFDQAPPSPERRIRSLKMQPEANGWPPAFIDLLDRILNQRDQAQPTLVELSDSLEKVEASLTATPELSPASTPEATPPAAEAAPVTDTASPAPESQGATAQEATAPAPAEPTLAPAPGVLPPPPAPPAPSWSLLPVTLPNAMVSRDYSVEVSPLLGNDWPTTSHVEVLSGMPAGLSLDDQIRISGTPTGAGDHSVNLRFHLKDQPPGRPASLERTLSLIVNPDPQSLWKNLPSDPDGPFAKSDTDTAALEGGPFTVLAASIRGRSHAHVGSYRDDDFSMSWWKDTSWYVLAAADGAGSAKFSRRGSQLACEAVKEHFNRYFNSADPAPLESFVAEWAAAPDNPSLDYQVKRELYTQFGTSVLAARKAIEDQAASVNATARDFHTTLICTLLRPLPAGDWFIAAFSIGDGGAAIIGVPGDEPCLLTRPDGGDFAGQTVFLTMKESTTNPEALMARIRTAIVPSFEALILVTDGISDPRFDSDALLADPSAWRGLWKEIRTVLPDGTPPAEGAKALAAWMAFHSPGHHDDRTAVIAYPPSHPCQP
jgi:serine/threonine protein phosphatase PrpC